MAEFRYLARRTGSSSRKPRKAAEIALTNLVPLLRTVVTGSSGSGDPPYAENRHHRAPTGDCRATNGRSRISHKLPQSSHFDVSLF
jgi:hypothetical protein